MNVAHRQNFFFPGGVASGLLPSVSLILNLFNNWSWWRFNLRPKIFSRMLSQKISPWKGLPSHQVRKSKKHFHHETKTVGL